MCLSERKSQDANYEMKLTTANKYRGWKIRQRNSNAHWISEKCVPKGKQSTRKQENAI